ncbi:MAG: arylsulfotransferase family protein [Candidatus Nanopelagicales bacterium]
MITASPLHRRTPALLTAAVLVLGVALVPATSATAAQAPAAAPPVHSVAVSGAGVGSYPAFDPAIERYAVTTTDATAGTVTVTATTSDPAGAVYVDGRLEVDGTATLTGLAEGDEIAVFIVDSAGTARHSFVYLPVGFPTLERQDLGAVDPAAITDGKILLTLGQWVAPSPFFQTAVDREGVPAMVRTTIRSMDLKPLAGGGYSVFSNTTGEGRTGMDQVELDASFQEVARHRTVGLVDTDGHDVVVAADGSRYLLAYEPDPATGLVDSVIQQQSATGEVLFQWNSRDHVDVAAETVVDGRPNAPDYAHVNSIQVMADGDLLVSFRHLSSVFKIARTAHDGLAEGDVVWRLGGHLSDFVFTDLAGHADGGPCAQHTARQLANGHILMFDNGAWEQEPLCIDPADPTGPEVARTPTRVTEWSLDEDTHEATMVWSFSVPTRYAVFAGSAERLPNGNTLIGWAASPESVATEVDPAGTMVWDLVRTSSPAYFTYRAALAAVPDVVKPVVALGASIDGAVYKQDDVAYAHFGCTDRGGSSLRTCAGSVAEGARLDTRDVGVHTVTVTATDGASNTTTRTATYRVVAGAYLPDVSLRSAAPGSRWVGVDRYGTTGQRVSVALTRAVPSRSALVRVTNDGSRADGVVVRGPASSRGVRVTYSLGGRDVTRAVTAGTLRVTGLAAGASVLLKVTVSRTSKARAGAERSLALVAASAARPSIRDVGTLRVVVRR